MHVVSDLEDCRPLIRSHDSFAIALSQPVIRFVEELAAGSFPAALPADRLSEFIQTAPHLGQIVSYSRYHQYHLFVNRSDETFIVEFHAPPGPEETAHGSHDF